MKRKLFVNMKNQKCQLICKDFKTENKEMIS